MPSHRNPIEPEKVVAVSAEEGKGAVPGEVDGGGGAQVGCRGEEEFGGGAMPQVTGVWCEVVFCQLSLVTKEINLEVALDPSLCLSGLGKMKLKEVVMFAVGGHSARLQVHSHWRSRPSRVRFCQETHRRTGLAIKPTIETRPSLEVSIAGAPVPHHRTCDPTPDGVNVESNGPVVGARH